MQKSAVFEADLEKLDIGASFEWSLPPPTGTGINSQTHLAFAERAPLPDDDIVDAIVSARCRRAKRRPSG